MKASIAIFENTLNYEDNSNSPEIPDEVFKAAEKIIQNKSGIEFVHSDHGMYLICHSETGPFGNDFENDTWEAVRIYRFEKWRAGGIRKDEMLKFRYGNIGPDTEVGFRVERAKK